MQILKTFKLKLSIHFTSFLSIIWIKFSLKYQIIWLQEHNLVCVRAIWFFHPYVCFTSSLKCFDVRVSKNSFNSSSTVPGGLARHWIANVRRYDTSFARCRPWGLLSGHQIFGFSCNRFGSKSRCTLPKSSRSWQWTRSVNRGQIAIR